MFEHEPALPVIEMDPMSVLVSRLDLGRDLQWHATSVVIHMHKPREHAKKHQSFAWLERLQKALL